MCIRLKLHKNGAYIGCTFAATTMAKRKTNTIQEIDDTTKVQDFEKDMKPSNSKKKTLGDDATKVRFWNDERFLKILGLLLILCSLYTIIAITSFFFTWDKDQQLVHSLNWSMFAQTDPDAAHNALGKVGAWLSYILVYRGVGISAYGITIFILAIGIRLLTQVELISISKSFRYGLLVVVWFPLVCGFVFQDVWQVLGGTYGHFGFQYLKGLLGNIGAALLLLTYSLVSMVAIFNMKFYVPRPPKSEIHPAALNDDEYKPSLTDEEESFLEKLNPDDFVLKENTIISTQTSKLTVEPDLIEVTNEDIPTAMPEEEILEPEPIVVVPPQAEIVEIPSESSLILEVNEIPEEEPVIADRPPLQYGEIGTEYDPRMDFPGYKIPGIELLKDYGDNKGTVESAELQAKTKMIEDTLKNYNISIKKISATIGPTVTLYEIVPQDGVRIAKIKNLEDDIALSLAALGIRIIAPIPGRGTIGIEVPNEKPAMVSMRGVISSPKFQNAEMQLPIAFGRNIQNEVFVADLAKMPHLLMAGATGQGKSVGLNAILVSLLYKKHPSEVKFVLVDPKKVELSIYKTIERHFLAKIPGDADAIITDTKLVVNTLSSLCKEMDDRYDLLKDAQVRNIIEYNGKFKNRKLNPENGHRYLPYIVVVIDELADLMMTAGKEVEMPIARLAQLARAIGIHLILATQRPSVNIITGTIKANFPARVAFRVSQKIDSRTILDANGADQLIGKGDMLFSNGNDLIRLQCAFVDTPEVDEIANFIGAQPGQEPLILPEVQTEGGEGGSDADFDPRERDSLFEEAAQIIVQHQQGSTSLLQRRLNLGYNRAGRLIDQLEKAGIVGPFKGSKAREVLIVDAFQLEEKLAELRNRS
jgi:S-DNA-T family DNA segregation ATPase FtsK/SpoIIIE